MSNMAGDVTAKAGQQWDKLESIFEERTAKALNKLGVPSSKDVDALIKRIDELSGAGRQAVEGRRRPRPPRAKANGVAKPAAKRAAPASALTARVCMKGAGALFPTCPDEEPRDRPRPGRAAARSARSTRSARLCALEESLHGIDFADSTPTSASRPAASSPRAWPTA
jgi:hypothetical protein